MDAITLAQELKDLFGQRPEVRSVSLYGSIVKGTADPYSDIDIKLDVSGYDNGRFLLSVPQVLAEKYKVLFSDYAPSLAPEQYVVSCALSEENPFLIVDVNCAAEPHVASVAKADLMNDPVVHVLKLWVANMKHFIRGQECYRDICKMHRKSVGDALPEGQELVMLQQTLLWLEKHVPEKLNGYVKSCRRVLEEYDG